jgi:membrane-associated protease RseP (regulator of RpoE activity)
VHLSCWGPAGTLGLEIDADGIHTFGDVAQGEYRCEATSADGSATASVVVRGEPTKLTLALADYATLTGVVVNALTDQPVAGITAMAKGTIAECDTAGRFTVERVSAGTDTLMLMPMDQLGAGADKHPFTAKPGEKVDLGRIKVVPPRTGDVGTFGLWLEVRDQSLIVTRVKAGGPAERAGIKVGDSIVAVEGQTLAVLGADRARRFLASEVVSIGQAFTVSLANGTKFSMTAIRW